jgi:hypothetical protein
MNGVRRGLPTFWFSPSISELMDSVAILEVRLRGPRTSHRFLATAFKKIFKVSEQGSKNKLSLSVQALAATCNLPNKSLTEASIFFSRQNWNQIAATPFTIVLRHEESHKNATYGECASGDGSR